MVLRETKTVLPSSCRRWYSAREETKAHFNSSAEQMLFPSNSPKLSHQCPVPLYNAEGFCGYEQVGEGCRTDGKALLNFTHWCIQNQCHNSTKKKLKDKERHAKYALNRDIFQSLYINILCVALFSCTETGNYSKTV